jgi:uncharacterized protein (TIGR00299 family) protein
MKVLYFDGFSGYSGDKIVAGLLSITGSADSLIKKLKTLSIKDDFEIKISQKSVMGINSLKFDVVLNDHHHHDDHGHSHEHAHHHHHRGLKEIIQIINESALDEKVKNDAINIFTILGRAESKVHNVDIEKIHFHEVGAVDSIIDIVSACILINELKPDKIYSSKIALGSGFIDAAHGRLPVPAPATAKILEGVPVYNGEINGELTTPTGASIIKYYSLRFCTLPEMTIDKIGYGAGTKEFEIPNVTRIYYGDLEEKKINSDLIVKLETNIDDATPEQTGFIFERLFEKGALDVFITPILMKKNRMAHLLTVLCAEKDKELLENEIFKNSTTFGIRFSYCERTILKRDQKVINVDGVDVAIKHGYYKDKLIQTSIEYDSLKNYIQRTGLSYNEAVKKINKIIHK